MDWNSLLLAFFSLPHHFPSVFCNVHKAMPSEVTLNGLPPTPLLPLGLPLQGYLNVLSYACCACFKKSIQYCVQHCIQTFSLPYLPCPIFTTVSSVFQHLFRSYFYSCISNSKSHLLFVLAWQVGFCMQTNLAGDFQPDSSYLSIKETRLIYSYNSLSAHIKYKLQTWQINVTLLHQLGM